MFLKYALQSKENNYLENQPNGRNSSIPFRHKSSSSLHNSDQNKYKISRRHMTATAGSDVVQSGRPMFDDFFQHLWPYIGNNTANVVFQIVKRLWLIRMDQ
ncbi:hypothetical protein TNCV_616741 [Trichonephila clavipes]|nr:hypothetical protein TNCV_616741 [Trichonephila clavipes]